MHIEMIDLLFLKRKTREEEEDATDKEQVLQGD